MNRLLIFDLDDTLFETRSIDFKQFDDAWKIIKWHFIHSEYKPEQIIEDLKDIPFDVVAKAYSFSNQLIEEIRSYFNTCRFTLNISVFDDYHWLQQLNGEKVIVTTGFTSFQHAKIDALGIRNEFPEIYIDDPLDHHRKFKKGIFRELLKNKGVSPERVWVIGDNPESELRAGKEMGFHTIQRLVKGREKSPYSDFAVDSFDLLSSIIC